MSEKKLNLDFNYLEEIFGIDFEKRIIYLKKDQNNVNQIVLNIQQLYNWFKNKMTQGENMRFSVSILDYNEVIKK